MKKHLLTLATILVSASLVTSSFAGKGGKKNAGLGGKVSAVTADSISISNKRLGDQIFKIDSSTKVLKEDGTSGALSDIQTGSRVRVTSGATSGEAGQIQIVPRRAKGKKNAAAPAASANPSPSASPAAH